MKISDMPGLHALIVSSVVSVLLVASAQPDPGTPGWDLFLSTQLAETTAPRALTVEGTIPEWLSGSLVRLGPAQYQVGSRTMQHQMDGFGKLHKYRFFQGGVEFQTRFLRSDAYKKSIEIKDVVPHLTFLPTDPPFTVTQTLDVLQGPSDNNGIFPWCTGAERGDICYASADGASPVAFDPVTLETVGHVNYTRDGAEHFGTSTADAIGGAHRLRQVGSDATIAWQVLQMKPIPFQKKVLQIYKDVVLNGRIERCIFGAVDVPRLPTIHSMAATRNYVIAVAPPLGINMLKMMKMRAQYAAMEWLEDEPTMVYVFDAHSTREDTPPVRTFKVPAFYVNHHINAHETTSKDGKPLLIFDCIAYQDGSFLVNPESPSATYVSHNASRLRKTRNEYQQIVRRFTLEMDSHSSREPNASWIDMPLFEKGSTSEIQVEMPRFDEKRFQGTNTCIFWAQGIPKNDSTYKKFNLVKADLCTAEGPHGGRLARVWKKENHWPVEPIFVPRPGAKHEDDGVLLAVVLDGVRAESYLLVLDAHTMEQIAVAYTGFVVPADFHGQFLPLTASDIKDVRRRQSDTISV